MTATVTWTLSGLGDEIHPDPVVQMAVLQSLGASHIEVRGAWNTNIAAFSDEQVTRFSEILAEWGMGVSAIASPIGKVDIGLPVEHEVARLERVITIAQRLDARYIRIFSFFHEGTSPESVRDDVLARMKALTDTAEQHNVLLIHENEKDIYGDTPERLVDIIESVGSPRLRIAWDNANFVQVGVHPFRDAYPLIVKHVEYLHIKDARFEDAGVTAAGEGDGELRETIAAFARGGFSGFASLEPHLASSSQFGGFSGPYSFGVAARAFRGLAEQAGVQLV